MAQKIKSLVYQIFFIVFCLTVGFAVAESIAQIYVYHVAKKGKLITVDDTLGWKSVPNLSLKRLNSDGEMWRIQTNADGYRTDASWKTPKTKRVLILGDSFAFGEGINREDRFDSLLSKRKPEWSFLNLGVMGYGTDQELLAGRDYFNELEEGDILVLLTCFNDYFDVLRKKFAGRSKPWFDYKDGELTEHSPVIGFRDFLRDRSYIFSKLFKYVEGNLYEYSFEDVKKGLLLYRDLVLHETEPLLQKGVIVIIAHHGEQLLYKNSQLTPDLFQTTLVNFCLTQRIRRIELDSYLLSSTTDNLFLIDGHWNKTGHKMVAEILHKYLTR